jgi:GDP/UDP-N,N'-diacetylbacillosamine 2-epimerase (hydrolysing)
MSTPQSHNAPKRIGILSSSRADFSIYEPLIRALKADPEFDPHIIAFGTHLSRAHGYTLDSIRANGFEVTHAIDHCYALADEPAAISQAMGRTLEQFSQLWATESFDLVFCLGDRYEMLAAVLAAKPFNIPFAHLYGGETTLGAMDEAFRHSISHLSQWHFTGAEPYAARVNELVQRSERIFNCGYINLDTLSCLDFISAQGMHDRCGLDMSLPTLLVTMHPETERYTQTADFADELCAALAELSEFQVLLTMPNSDTHGNQIRSRVLDLQKHRPGMICVENLGTLGYASAMKHCSAMLGNTSSGFVEASFFPKPVINLGLRQEGRILTPNIAGCDFIKADIVNAVRRHCKQTFDPNSSAIYGQGNSTACIIQQLKTHIFPTLQA